MRIIVNALVITVVLAALCVPCQAVPDNDPAAPAASKPTSDEVKAAATKWLDKLGPVGLVHHEKVKEGGFVVTHGVGALGAVTKFSMNQGPWWVSLTFHGELSAETSLEILKKSFWHLSLDKLPTPGLEFPAWDIRLQTPTSTIDRGVELLAYRDGMIKLRVRTTFFALYGRDTSVLVPADAPAPVGSYFQIRKDFPLDLTLEAPVLFPK